MFHNEIIISNRHQLDDIKSGKIDYFIRLGQKNKWTIGSIFDLKTSHVSTDSVQIKIISSEQIPVKNIPISILSQCGYRSQSDFKKQWEEWFQNWDDISEAWVIHFELYVPSKYVDYSDIFA